MAGGNSTIIGDAKNWPAFEGRSLSGYQSKRVWLNDGAGKFVDVAQAVGVTDTYDGRAVALADLWNRGVLDVVVANQKGPLLVYKNTVTPENEWIEFELEGTASNRSAIGAQVTLFWNGQQQVQEVSGGSGFAAQNQRRLHFGLGKYPQMEKAVIRWPSGKATDHRQACRRPAAQDQGACMSQQTAHLTPATGRACRLEAFRQPRQPLHRPDFHHLHPAGGPPVVRHSRKLSEDPAGDRGQLSRRSWLLGRIFFHKWVHPASAYISGISVGILVRSPAFWPYALCAAISIMSKYVLRIKGRHIWNPSNFGISAMLFLVPETVASLSIQWGNYLLPMLVIWVLGSVIIWRLQRFHITVTYVASFIAFAFLRSWMTGKSVAVRDCADHRTDVPALHFLHDHRSEDHGAIEEVAVRGGIPGRAGRNDHADEPDRLRAVLCAVHRGTDRHADRDLAGFATCECGETGSRRLTRCHVVAKGKPNC